jgi:hypothetical protein
MKQFLALFIIVVSWLAGIAIAKGAELTIFAVLFAPFAWYLVVEKLLNVIGCLR